MNKIILALMIGLGFQGTANAEHYDITGISLGEDKSLLVARGFSCMKMNVDKEFCSATRPYMEYKNVDFLINLKDNSIGDVTITFHPNKFESYLENLKVKYGNPKSIENSIIKNGFGVEFNQITAIWENEEGDKIILQKYLKINESYLNFSSKIYNESLKHRPSGENM